MLTKNHSIAVPRPLETAVEPKRGFWSRYRREVLGGIVLLSPALLILTGLVIYPFVYAIWLSFSDQMVGVAGHFVGLKNFR